jgi:hypothetical protein
VKIVYKYKKNLKSSPKDMYKSVNIMDDVTPLRLRLKAVVSKIPGVEATYFRDGNVHCKFKGKNFKLTSPDDIFGVLKVDQSEEMMKELGLQNFL